MWYNYVVMKKANQLSQIALPVSILKEGKYFIAYSPVLDLSTSSKTFEEVKKRFDEAVEIFFEELIDKGTLDKVLAELGWEKIKGKWAPPIVISHETEHFRLAFSA